MNQSFKPTQRIVKFLLYFLGLFLIALAFWTERYFGRVDVDQALFTFQSGLDGALTADFNFIRRVIRWCILSPLLIAIILAFVELHVRIRRLTLILCGIGLIAVSYQYSFLSFIKQFTPLTSKQIDFFSSHYINANNLPIQAAHPKNLILIYVESLETAYSEEKLFGRNLLQGFNAIKSPHMSFNQYQQMPGTGWTIAGIVSTQCGIPLKPLTIFGNNGQGEMLNSFLPHVKCLSDILAENGYRNIFMKGASLRFSGTQNFLKTHHYHEMYGKEEWLAKGYKVEQMNRWGLQDDDLFEQAKLRLSTLMQSKKPFNLTLLTVGMHGPEGFLNPACRKRGYRNFDGIVECTTQQLTEFINYVHDKGWLNQVTIVVLGDHLTMKNIVSDKLDRSQNRSIFNLFITGQPLSKNTDHIVHFDMLPTILNSLGFNIPGHQLGLGYSAIRPEKSIQPNDRFSEMERRVTQFSQRYNQLW